MVDKKHMDKLFDNSLEKVGHEFGELEARKEQFIKENVGKYRLEPFVPKNIPGLTPRTNARIPASIRWFKTTGSFERNGFFNIHTPILNTKAVYWTFFTTIIWGNVQYVWMGLYQEEHYDNFELRNNIYDKLSTREIPLTRIWQRPG